MVLLQIYSIEKRNQIQTFTIDLFKRPRAFRLWPLLSLTILLLLLQGLVELKDPKGT